ncbi:PLP-dependent aminotransferase family protein [Desulfitobacterium sp. PCE1]|uniref:MocR-like pyridoxine biosynthesis transcription factor PdxR n=1 Tax=Desulfitobacterium sp. PCE1 TaxID=146907 RepID=UPI000366743C|nr:PLP-dependent aminotransferase family protein [Desulfitobacterium sp. PCE1]
MIYIDKEMDTPLYEQIYRQIQEDIISGNLSPGTLLPGIRTLSKTLGVARNTVDKAYTQLAVEGYICPRKGAGFAIESIRDSKRSGEIQNLSCAVTDDSGHETEERNLPYDFQYGSFPDECFPKAAWKKYMLEVLSSPDSSSYMTQYQDKQGNRSLRCELRNYLYQTRGVVCTEAQILIGCGLHYSLDSLCKLFASHKRIAMEEPGYNGAKEVFQNNGFLIRHIPSTQDGLDFSGLKTLDVPAVYVTPSHQFPYGTVLPISKRRELLEWAAEENAYIIEDDYDSEYRYDANPVPSLQSIDGNDRVIYIGTFSKSLSPSLRINYMVVPKHLLGAYHQMFSSYSSPVTWLTQEVLARFLRSGDYTRHVRRMCAVYRKRHDIFVQQLSKQFGPKIVLHGQGAGLHFLLEFSDGVHADRLILTAKKAGVRVYPVTPFWSVSEACPPNMLFAGYSLLNEGQIQGGIRLLKQAWAL